MNVIVATPFAGKAHSDLMSVTVIFLPSESHFAFAFLSAISRAPVMPPRAGDALAETWYVSSPTFSASDCHAHPENVRHAIDKNNGEAAVARCRKEGFVERTLVITSAV